MPPKPLRRHARVVYAEPNLLFQLELDAYTPNDPLFNQVPYLGLIRADEAWDRLDNVSVALRGGSPTITVGVANPQGVAPDHPDLTANLTDGTGKLVTSVNFSPNPIVNQTAAGLFGDHGTQCATSAVAAFDDNRGLPGVAPNCHLIGAQIRDRTDAVRMSDLYLDEKAWQTWQRKGGRWRRSSAPPRSTSRAAAGGQVREPSPGRPKVESWPTRHVRRAHAAEAIPRAASSADRCARRARPVRHTPERRS